MEALEAVCGGEWNSFNGMFSEEADFMAQLLANCPLSEEVSSNSTFGLSSYFWSDHEPNVSMVSVDGSAASDETNTDIYCFSQGSGYCGGSSIFFPTSCNGRNWPFDSHIFTSNDLKTDKKNNHQISLRTNGAMGGGEFLNLDDKNFESDNKLPEDVYGKNSQLRTSSIPELMKNDESSPPSEILKKRPQIPLERAKKRVKSNKGSKVDDSFDNNTNLTLHGQSSSSCCSEDDSTEMNGVSSSSSSKGSGKARASRGSATDPQSLYARKRRERINERLRILQNLVPNGTKVDISTMLEDAVQYVKFLQHQIKLLSSDEMWMYAPIAYNGMDIGLDLNISNPKPQS